MLEEEKEDTLLLGEVSTRTKPETWKKTLKVNGKRNYVQVGGADATVISVTAYCSGTN